MRAAIYSADGVEQLAIVTYSEAGINILMLVQREGLEELLKQIYFTPYKLLSGDTKDGVSYTEEITLKSGTKEHFRAVSIELLRVANLTAGLEE